MGTSCHWVQQNNAPYLHFVASASAWLPTSPRLHLAEHQDSRRLALAQQLEAWFTLMQAQPSESRQTHHLVQGGSLAYAPGPMTGLMCRLKDAGWTAPAPQDWQKDGVSHAVEYDDPIKLIQLVQLAQDKLEHELWITAACHKGGQGAQEE